jgi:hypothetical protein
MAKESKKASKETGGRQPQEDHHASPMTPPESNQDGVELEAVSEAPTVAYQGVVWTNTESDIIQITEDKAIIALNRFARKISTEGLIAPLGIEISLIALLVTSEFKTRHFGLAADTWRGIFVAATILVFIWLMVAATKLTRGGRAKVRQACIKEMKGQE